MGLGRRKKHLVDLGFTIQGTRTEAESGEVAAAPARAVEGEVRERRGRSRGGRGGSRGWRGAAGDVQERRSQPGREEVAGARGRARHRAASG